MSFFDSSSTLTFKQNHMHADLFLTVHQEQYLRSSLETESPERPETILLPDTLISATT